MISRDTGGGTTATLLLVNLCIAGNRWLKLGKLHTNVGHRSGLSREEHSYTSVGHRGKLSQEKRRRNDSFPIRSKVTFWAFHFCRKSMMPSMWSARPRSGSVPTNPGLIHPLFLRGGTGDGVHVGSCERTPRHGRKQRRGEFDISDRKGCKK